MQIYSVNGDFYDNYDLAVINAIGTKYMVKSHDLIEGYEIDLETSDNKRLLTFIDESGKEYSIDFEVSFSKENDAPFGDEFIDYEIDGIWIEGASINSLNISQKFKDEILSEIESVVEREINKM